MARPKDEGAAATAETTAPAPCATCATPTTERVTFALGTRRCDLGHLHAVVEIVPVCPGCQAAVADPRDPLTNYAVLVAAGAAPRMRALAAVAAETEG